MTSNIALRVIAVVVVVVMTSHEVKGHGYMAEPPGRSSMWRYGFHTPENYDDNGLNCGGLGIQWGFVNQGRCGVCGDPWDSPAPRPNEAGGLYGTGIITRTYVSGQTIDVRIVLTTNHKGWFEFRLCVHNNPSTPITHQCLDQNLLQLADGSGTRYTLANPNAGTVDLMLVLPQGVTCTQCVLQWKWHTDNHRGGNEEMQEEFYACSDVAIGASGVTVTPPTTAPPTPPPTHPPTINPPVNSGQVQVGQPYTQGSTCSGINIWQGKPELDRYCNDQCPHGNCPLLYCTCATQLPPATVAPTVTNPGVCRAIGQWQGNPMLDTWCQDNCARGTCPMLNCHCDIPTTTTSTTTTTTTTTATTTTTDCYAIGLWLGIAMLDTWCQDNCPKGLCPSLNCQCSGIAPRTTKPPTIKTTTVAGGSTCYGINAWQGVPELDKYCDANCRLGNCVFTAYCACLAQPSQQTTTPVTTAPMPIGSLACRAVGQWAGTSNLDLWCTQMCSKSACDPQYCSCSGAVVNTPAVATSSPTPPPTIPLHSQGCHAINSWAGVPELDLWCVKECAIGICPPAYCQC